VKVNKRGDTMIRHLDMGDNKITSRHVPRQDDDLINKKHLKTLYTANSSGHIPDLTEDSASSGFIVSSSSNQPQRLTFHAFTGWKLEWISTTKENCWIQVKCPEAIRLHKFGLRGRRPNVDKISHWKLEASDDDINWVSLYTTANISIGNTTQFFEPAISPLCKFYKITVLGAEGNNPGLSYFQLFTYDIIHQPNIVEIVNY